MPDKKLTDNLSNNSPILANELSDSEIKKALECSVKDKCPECPYFHSYPCDKCREMRKDALDLINRYEAEIEKQKKKVEARNIVLAEKLAEVERLQKAIQVQEIMLEQQDYKLKRAKAEAYKEFATKTTDKVKKVKQKYEKDILNELVGDGSEGGTA